MFVGNITETLKPLYDLLRKDKKFEWNERTRGAFKEIKEKMCEKLKLTMPDSDKIFELETDASEVGIGAALRQEGKPIAYASRSLTTAEQKYGITERETLAALWGWRNSNII
jgi:hypothetical protein